MRVYTITCIRYIHTYIHTHTHITHTYTHTHAYHTVVCFAKEVFEWADDSAADLSGAVLLCTKDCFGAFDGICAP
jgi:hypothetical protein